MSPAHHHHDDEPGHESLLDGGHVTRRGAIGAAGAGGVALLFAGLAGTHGGKLADALGPDIAEAASGSCVMTPAKTVGPYFVDVKLNRSDVRANTADGAVQSGVPLTLKLQVFNADSDCAPVSGATVDIWHANAAGVYSDEAMNNTSGQNWLRGYQTTDANGLVTFTTIYPGWYSGRAVHIHFKVRLYDGTTETLEFTSQMFFTDAMNQQVFANNAPYNQRSSTPDTVDAKDSILGSDASTLTLSPVSDGNGGYSADFSVGVSSKTSQLNNDSAGGPGGGTGPTPPTSSGTTTTSPDESVSARLTSAKLVRSALGTRQVKLTLTSTETIAVRARLTRSGKTLADKTVVLAKGTKALKVTVPDKTAAGAATLKVTIVDARKNTKTYSRTLHISARRRS